MQLIDYHTSQESPRGWDTNARSVPITPYSAQRVSEFAIDVLAARNLLDASTIQSLLFTAELVELPRCLRKTDFAVFLSTFRRKDALSICKNYFYACRVFGHKLNVFSRVVGGVHSFFALEELAYLSVSEIAKLLQKKEEMHQSIRTYLPVVTGKIKCKEPMQRLSTLNGDYDVLLISFDQKTVALFNGYKIATLSVDITKKRGYICQVQVNILEWHEAPFSDIYWTHRLLREKLESFFNT